jgi:hypothetical protein
VKAIPLADASALQAAGRRTFTVRAVLAALCIGAALAVVLVANIRTGRSVPGAIDPRARSLQASSDRLRIVTLARSRRRPRLGPVPFSAQAHEALPPGTPAADLAPFVRYFTLPTQRTPGFAPSFPDNPWGSTFTGGTKISAGLDLAHEIALAGGKRAAVVLVSDLDDDPSDLPRLASVLLAYRRDHVPVRIVGLDASPDNVALYTRLLSPQPVVVEAPTLAEAPPRDTTPVPWLLLILSVIAVAAYVARAVWAPRLVWGDQ